MKLSDLLQKLNLKASNLSSDVEITCVSSLDKGSSGAISFLANPKYHTLVASSKASAIFVPEQYTGQSEAILIPCANPSRALSEAIAALGLLPALPEREVSPRAVVHESAVIGEDCSIGPNAVIEANVVIGAHTIVGANCYIGSGVKIGANSRLYPNVVIYYDCVLGDRVVIHSNTTIGSDGFGFELEGNSAKIPQVGKVIISDDVEIGANVSIDRARFDATRIGRYTKIDNQVQIGHNVEIGERCMIVSQVGIAGSCVIGNNVILAGQVGVVGHIRIGDGAIIAAKAGVGNNVEKNAQISGHYGQNHKEVLRQYVAVKQLPDILKKIKKMLKDEENQ